jgi:hypothetical protein
MEQKEKREIQFRAVQDSAFELFKKKNSDYGDAFAEYGVVGVLVRMGDKLRRYVSVSNKGVSLVNDESLKDTLIDLHNYAAMALLLLYEQKVVTEEITKVHSDIPFKSFDEWQKEKAVKFPELYISS